jgi:hypothetical protein
MPVLQPRWHEASEPTDGFSIWLGPLLTTTSSEMNLQTKWPKLETPTLMASARITCTTKSWLLLNAKTIFLSAWSLEHGSSRSIQGFPPHLTTLNSTSQLNGGT